MIEQDLTQEFWREYDFAGRTYRIDVPVKLYMRPGGSTHRILDKEGVMHCVPAPGNGDCVLRWKPVNPEKPVQF